MTVTTITQEDLPECLGFIERFTRDAMFPLANFQNFGLAGPENKMPRAMSFRAHRSNGEITAILGQSREGILFPVFGDLDSKMYDIFLPSIDAPVLGVIGLQDHARPLLHLLAAQPSRKLDTDEPQLKLELAQLTCSADPELRLSPITPEHRQTAIAWRTDYSIVLLNVARDRAQSEAAVQINGYIESDSHRLLLRDGEPVAMTGFNAQYQTHVQIGGVFTPPNLRGNGYAGTALALHLLQARARGITHAVLRAANEAAASVYRRIGFEDCGRFTIVLFEDGTPT